jgi:hypothetical protein
MQCSPRDGCASWQLDDNGSQEPALKVGKTRKSMRTIKAVCRYELQTTAN